MSTEKMQVIVINPFTKEISYDFVSNPKLTKDYASYNQEMYNLMSKGPISVHVMEQAYLQTVDAKKQDGIMVDENGLLGNLSKQKFFIVEGAYPQPLAGIGVVVGSDNRGNSIATCLTIEWFKNRVKFYSFADVQRIYG